nr:Runt-related transcription factor 3 isoform 9 [Danio rerio]
MHIPVDPSTSRRFTPPSASFPCAKVTESQSMSAPGPLRSGRPVESRSVVDVLADPDRRLWIRERPITHQNADVLYSCWRSGRKHRKQQPDQCQPREPKRWS